MSPVIPSIITNIFGTLVLASLYFFLYAQYRERYIGIWTLSLFFYAGRLGFDLWMIYRPDLMALPVANYIFALATGLSLLWGTCTFLNRPVPRWWLYASAVDVLWGLAAFKIFKFSFFLLAFPTASFLGAIYIWTGIVFFRIPRSQIDGASKNITAVAFIVWGLHNIDYPFLRSLELFASWGYLADAVLKIVIAVGILLVYFQKIRRDLSLSEERFRLLAENARDVVFRYRLDPPGFDYVSPSVAEITGYEPGELTGDTALIDRVVHPGDYEAVAGAARTLDNHSKTFRLVRKDGAVIWVESRSVVIRDRSGKIEAIEGIVRDITQRVKAEGDLAEARQKANRAERLASLGTMAAGIIHEINQPLNALKIIVEGMLFWLRKGKHYEPGEVTEELNGVSDQIRRIEKIVQRIRSFVRNDSPEDLSPCDLNSAVEGALDMVGSQLSAHGIGLSRNLGQNIPQVLGDKFRLEEVVANLAINAMQALDKLDRENKVVVCSTSAGENVVLEVSDNASGISEENRARIFEPFFTTKDSDVGMGLGLSIVESIVTSFNGQIYVRTNESGGATFRVVFPVCRAL